MTRRGFMKAGIAVGALSTAAGVSVLAALESKGLEVLQPAQTTRPLSDAEAAANSFLPQEITLNITGTD